MDFHNPTQTVLVSSKLDDKENISVCNFHMPTSIEPRIYAVSLNKNSLSKELIEKSKVFVVNFMPFRYTEEVKKCGLISGKHKNKFETTNLRKENCEMIDSFYIKESSAYIECEVNNVMESGDHVVFFGEIIGGKVFNDEKRLLKKDKGSFTTTIH